LPGPPPLGIEIGTRNSVRGDRFFTLDLRGERRFTLAHGELRVVLEVQNVTDRANYCCSELRFERDGGGALVAREVRRDWLPLLPQASVAWEW
jgi:hypothetical protein